MIVCSRNIMEKFDLVEVTKTTAMNLHDLLFQLADHIRSLENEIIDLKQQLSSQSNDTK
jgi:hypothetical protein